jgi:hypothetical protein
VKLTPEQIIADLRREAQRLWDIADGGSRTSSRYYAQCRFAANLLRTAASSYDRGELITKENA